MGGSHDDVGSDEDIYVGDDDDLDLGEDATYGSTHGTVYVVLNNDYMISAGFERDHTIWSMSDAEQQEFVKSRMRQLLA